MDKPHGKIVGSIIGTLGSSARSPLGARSTKGL